MQLQVYLSVLLTHKQGLMQTLWETQMAVLDSYSNKLGYDRIGKLVPQDDCSTVRIFLSLFPHLWKWERWTKISGFWSWKRLHWLKADLVQLWNLSVPSTFADPKIFWKQWHNGKCALCQSSPINQLFETWLTPSPRKMFLEIVSMWTPIKGSKCSNHHLHLRGKHSPPPYRDPHSPCWIKKLPFKSAGIS